MNNLSFKQYCGSWVLAVVLLVPTISLTALASGQLSGELWMHGIATVNGKTVTTGLTILSGSRIQTGKDSTAIISLGPLGRIKLQAESELILTFTEKTINGKLLTGVAMLSAPETVVAVLRTPCGEFDSTREQNHSSVMEVTVAAKPDGIATEVLSEADKAKSSEQETSSGQNAGTGRCIRIGKSAQHQKIPVLFAGGWGIPALIVGGLFGTLISVALLQDSNVNGLVIGPPVVTPVRPN